MNKTSSTRIFAILARSAPVGVILRRGPSKQVQLIKWNLGSDTLEYGQWFKGRIYERRCDLSPSGELLLYFAAKYKEPLRSWTAISKPPYLTALALWPKGDGWGGGGLFDSELSVQLNHRPGEDVLQEGLRLKKNMRIRLYGSRPGWGEDFPIYHSLLLRNGWNLAREGECGSPNWNANVVWEFTQPITYEKNVHERPASADAYQRHEPEERLLVLRRLRRAGRWREIALYVASNRLGRLGWQRRSGFWQGWQAIPSQ